MVDAYVSIVVFWLLIILLFIVDLMLINIWLNRQTGPFVDCPYCAWDSVVILIAVVRLQARQCLGYELTLRCWNVRMAI
jgi:hypothetical protein